MKTVPKSRLYFMGSDYGKNARVLSGFRREIRQTYLLSHARIVVPPLSTT
jgi:hypothetical protein